MGCLSGKTRFRLLAAILGLVFLAPHRAEASGGLVINEVAGRNTVYSDEDGDSPDWIELFNGSDRKADLKGYCLADSEKEFAKWRFPEVAIGPGQYMVIFASRKNKTDPQAQLHTNFVISDKDKGVYLFDGKGNLLDAVPISMIPGNASYGRSNITGEFGYFSSPTPGGPNIYPSFSRTVEYSVPGGIYPGSVTVKLSSGAKDSTIYYTTDGSTPTVASAVYSKPVTIDRNTTVRAIALEKGHLVSPPTGQTYFIGFDNKGMAIVAIATESEKLWDAKRGLFRSVGYADHMVRDNVRVHVSYFDEAGKTGFSQDAVMGVCGATSRELMMRPLKISADDKIDPMHPNFKYRLFPRDIDEYRHFQLRNNNQDGIRYVEDPECRPTMGIRNALFSAVLHDDKDIDIRYDNGPVLFFINGKNYGMMNIGQKRDNTGAREENPSAQSKDIDTVLIRDDMGARIGRDKLGEGAVFIRNDGQSIYKGYFMDGAVEYEEISESSRYNGNTGAIDDFIALDPTDAGRLDPKTFLASMAAHTIACNNDYGMNNIAFWRVSPMGQAPGTFYTQTFDFDTTFGLFQWRDDYNTLLDYDELTPLFPRVIKKEEYKVAFIRKIDEFLNGPFRPENVEPIIDRLRNNMDPWIEYHLDLWAKGKMDKARWTKNVEELKRFANVRPKHVRLFMADFFGFPGYSDMDFSVMPEGGGAISMDTGVFDIGLAGRGTYAAIPMKIRARASPGYVFSHFVINGAKVSEQEYTLTPENGMKIQAVFKEGQNAPVSGLCINEAVRSGKLKLKDEDGQSADWIELYNTAKQEIDITGMYISDNELKLKKWQFPKMSIGAGEFLVVFASGKDRKDAQHNLHTSFKLSKKEPIILTDRDGATILDVITADAMEVLPKDCAWIRYPDGTAVVTASKVATPGQPNPMGEK